MNDAIMDLRLKGYCCSQIIMQMGLEKLGKENKDLVATMVGLCNGLGTGKVCGCLSAGICLLFLADPKIASEWGARELTDWFVEAFDETECNKLLEDKVDGREIICPMLIENTMKKIEEILEW